MNTCSRGGGFALFRLCAHGGGTRAEPCPLCAPCTCGAWAGTLQARWTPGAAKRTGHVCERTGGGLEARLERSSRDGGTWPPGSRLPGWCSWELGPCSVLPEGHWAEAPWLPSLGSFLHLCTEGPTCPVSSAVRWALGALCGGHEGTEGTSDKDMPPALATANPAWVLGAALPTAKGAGGLGAWGGGGWGEAERLVEAPSVQAAWGPSPASARLPAVWPTCRQLASRLMGGKWCSSVLISYTPRCALRGPARPSPAPVKAAGRPRGGSARVPAWPVSEQLGAAFGHPGREPGALSKPLCLRQPGVGGQQRFPEHPGVQERGVHLWGGW